MSERGPEVHGTVDTHKHMHVCAAVGGSCVDQFLLYDGSCLLRIGPKGHQMGVKQRSMSSHRGLCMWEGGALPNQ